MYMIRSRRKRNTIAMITAMAVVLCMAAPVSAAYETTFGGFKCRGLDIPAYSGNQYVTVNNNETTFTAPEKASRSTYEKYSALDSKGRVSRIEPCPNDETPSYWKLVVDKLSGAWDGVPADKVKDVKVDIGSDRFADTF